MSNTTAADTPPLGFERKLSTSIQRLRANGTRHERSFTFHEPSRSQLGLRRLKSINRRGTCDLNNDEALFYLSLPEKIRRLHFTREENILMRAACEIQLSKHPRYENVFPPQKLWSEARASTSHSHASTLVNRDVMLEPAYASSDPSTSEEGRSSMPDSLDSSRPRTSSAVSSDGSILPFNPLACHPPGSSRGPSLSQSQLDNTRLITKTADAPGTAAKHYLDPQTRSKIRQYLASSAAFDEILTFGFPADEHGPATDSHKAFNRQFDEDLNLSDDTFEDSSDEEDDLHTDTDEDPTTPGSENTLATSWGFNSPYLPIQRQDSDGFRTQEREMTLRLTLTKPEVISAVEGTPTRPSTKDKQTRSSSKESDPLALEELTFSDDLTGMYGAFAVSPSKDRGKVKKLFKKLQRASTAPGF